MWLTILFFCLYNTDQTVIAVAVHFLFVHYLLIHLNDISINGLVEASFTLWLC